jgi:hypothetical protein
MRPIANIVFPIFVMVHCSALANEEDAKCRSQGVALYTDYRRVLAKEGVGSVNAISFYNVKKMEDLLKESYPSMDKPERRKRIAAFITKIESRQLEVDDPTDAYVYCGRQEGKPYTLAIFKVVRRDSKHAAGFVEATIHGGRFTAINIFDTSDPKYPGPKVKFLPIR